MTDSASLGSDNFRYITTHLEGYEKETKVLGIGGLGKQALANEAKKDMLMGNELLPNAAVGWKTSFFVFFSTTECTVTADIVEFSSAKDSSLGASLNSNN